ncbi:MAG: hypothetical protein IJD82_10980 [Clostridia bacterium]|nr:hypothetical protein [Clostridia bacterium]
MKLTKKPAILLAAVGGLAVTVSIAIALPALAKSQPVTGIIGGADLPTMLLLLSHRVPSAIVWLLVSGMLCLIASAVTAIVGVLAKTAREE